MNTLVATFSVLFGLLFGSFLNVCISRLPCGESILTPRSHCPRCGAPIRPLDNIPLLSWVLLRGRCHDCHAAISLRYPLIEAVMGALFLLCFLSFGLSIQAAGAAVLCFLLVGLAAMDAETLLLPNAFTLPGIALGILYSVIRGPAGEVGLWPRDPSINHRLLLEGHPRLGAALASALTACAAAALILFIRWIYWLLRHQEGMGLGDVKLFAMIAAWFGPAATLLVFFLAVITGALFGLALLLSQRTGSASRKSSGSPVQIPFGAFLCGAGLYTIFHGPQTLKWYFSFFS